MEKLLKVLCMAKPVVDAGTFEKSDDLYGRGIIDSFDILVIVDEINEAYGIEITGASFSRKDFYTINDIYNMIKRHGGE